MNQSRNRRAMALSVLAVCNKPDRVRHSSVVMLVLAALLVCQVGSTQVPDNFSYQGYLTDSSGQAIDAAVSVEFSLYAVATGGVPLWSEVQAVDAQQGVFSAVLGAGALNPFPVALFEEPLFLGIKVNADAEMMPRTELTSAPFAHQARDAMMLGGKTASELDQSSAVTGLEADVGAVQTDVSQLQIEVTGLDSGLTVVATDVTQLQTDLTTAESDITQLQTDVSSVEGDVTTIEATLPTLQQRVAQSCASGSSIRQIASNGGVTCEIDDSSLWLTSGANAYLTSGGRVGVGTSAPAASIQIDSPVDVDPFRARVASSTKLRVHANGSVSVGTSSAGPENGLYVGGSVGVGTSAPVARLTTTDTNWQLALDNTANGGDDWYMGSSADAWAIGGGNFVISPTANSNNPALVIDDNRDIGIGTTVPATKLHVAGGSDVNAVSGGFLTIGSLTSSHIAFDNNEIMARNNGAVAQLALNAEGGRVTINSGGSRDHDSLRVVGRIDFDNGGNSGMRISATDSSPTNALFEPTLFEEGLIGFIVRPFWRIYSKEFYASTPIDYKTYSDRSLKQDIATIPNALDTILALEGVTYALKKHPMDNRKRKLSDDELFKQQHQLGFIAQDLEQVLPQLVSEDETSGLKTVGYMGLIPILVEAIKQQQDQIDAQQEQIEMLNDLLR